MLAALAPQGKVPWASVRWFVTDERCGDDDAQDSSRQVVMMTLLAPNRAPARNLSHPDVAQAPAAAASAWIDAVREVQTERGGFDLVVLTVGPDGRVAGLGSDGSAEGEVVVGADGCVSLGPAVLEAARRVLVVATGADTEAVVHQALTGAPAASELSCARVLPTDPRVTWYVDRAAVRRLLADARVAEA